MSLSILIGITRLFIENGIDINFKDESGDNAFIKLCQYYKNVNLKRHQPIETKHQMKQFQ
jgi:acyl-CoA synthetase (NDP forming)